MFRYRLLSASVLIPLVLGLTYLGGVWFLGLVLVVLTLAGNEYADLLKRNDGGPSRVWVLVALWLLVLDAGFPQVQLLRPGMTAMMLGILAWAVVRYERGHASAVMDWTWTVAGGLYLGWLGAHFVLLRNLGSLPRATFLAPAQGEGLWWTVLAVAVAWLADTGAFFAGRAWGRHKMSPRVSPYKTWEGFAGGVAFGALGGVVIAALIRVIVHALGYTIVLTIGDGLALGVLVAVLSPLGDLGESMIKRHAGAKDSGQLIPGHGGMFDRIDSLLWAAAIAFYYAVWVAHV